MNLSSLVTRVDEILAMGHATAATCRASGGHFSENVVASDKMAGFRSAGLSFIERVFSSEQSHYVQFKAKTGRDLLEHAQAGIAILGAIRQEIAGGWLFTVKGLVAAELFADFMSMAEHLLETGYKDPAAVMAGSVLEEHLRQLCGKHGVDVEEERDGKLVPLKADRLNAELVKKGGYNKLDQKLVTAWLEVRNNAAHGKYELYTRDHVAQMIPGVLGFMSRVPL
ncbi:hypothetical protein ASC95_16185 [Pelomonas sp. Root1217]|nr:hypothetical protein ASC95_16185 [Pelomonas sp. Root1217]